jgi:hypothetical protein
MNPIKARKIREFMIRRNLILNIIKSDSSKYWMYWDRNLLKVLQIYSLLKLFNSWTYF